MNDRNIVYISKTGNYLAATQRICDTWEAAIEHIKEIVDRKEKWVHEKYLHKSYWLFTVDTEKVPNFKKIFPERLRPRPPQRPTKSERGDRAARKP